MASNFRLYFFFVRKKTFLGRLDKRFARAFEFFPFTTYATCILFADIAIFVITLRNYPEEGRKTRSLADVCWQRGFRRHLRLPCDLGRKTRLLVGKPKLRGFHRPWLRRSWQHDRADWWFHFHLLRCWVVTTCREGRRKGSCRMQSPLRQRFPWIP